MIRGTSGEVPRQPVEDADGGKLARRCQAPVLDVEAVVRAFHDTRLTTGAESQRNDNHRNEALHAPKSLGLR
jgi:hypothetical protein